MQVGNASSQSARQQRVLDDTAERWAIPIGQLAGTRLSLSYTVFFSAAIVVAVVLTLWERGSNTDLPRTAALGIAFWISGWFAQAVTQIGLTRFLGLRMTRLNVGLIGVEAIPRYWSAPKTLVVSLGTVVSLLSLGLLFLWVEGDFRMPVLARVSSQMWTAPSIGFSSHDSIWRSGAWLCWVQCLFQMYPLPRTLGRQTLAALAGICGRGLDLPSQSLILRRCLGAIAALTVILAVALMSGESQVFVLKWPLMLLLGILLWASSYAADVTAILTGFTSQPKVYDAAATLRIDQPQTPKAGPILSIRRSIQSRHDRRRVQLVMERERGEASDAARLDEILSRLHGDGMDSLSQEDLAILDRVSENLRNQRQTDAQTAEDSR